MHAVLPGAANSPAGWYFPPGHISVHDELEYAEVEKYLPGPEHSAIRIPFLKLCSHPEQNEQEAEVLLLV